MHLAGSRFESEWVHNQPKGLIMYDPIPLGGNRMRLLNVLDAAQTVCDSAPSYLHKNIEILRWTLEALPEGWQELMLDEIIE